jgi:hypothetical protein
MWDGSKVKISILSMNDIRSSLARLEQAMPSFCRRIIGVFLSIFEEMTARRSLDDDCFLRPVRLFTVIGVPVLSSVLSKPLGTSVITGYITQAINPICGWDTFNNHLARGFGLRMRGSSNFDPVSLVIHGGRSK